MRDAVDDFCNVNLSSCTPWRCMGGGGMTLFVLSLDVKWKWIVNFMFRPLYPRRKGFFYPLVRKEAVWVPELARVFWRRKKALVEVGNWNTDLSNPARNLVVVPTEPSLHKTAYNKPTAILFVSYRHFEESKLFHLLSSCWIPKTTTRADLKNQQSCVFCTIQEKLRLYLRYLINIKLYWTLKESCYL